MHAGETYNVSLVAACPFNLSVFAHLESVGCEGRRVVAELYIVPPDGNECIGFERSG